MAGDENLQWAGTSGNCTRRIGKEKRAESVFFSGFAGALAVRNSDGKRKSME